MQRTWLALILVVPLAACESKSDLEVQQQHVALQMQLDQARAQEQALRTEVESLQKQVASTQHATDAATAAAAPAAAQVPALPVAIAVQAVKGESGYSVALTRTVKQDLRVDLTLQSRSANAVKHKSFNLSQEGQTAFRFIEGVPFDKGDVITIESQGYQKLTATIGG
jgi:uncharacterized protein YlxW (UPF0749 family)